MIKPDSNLVSRDQSELLGLLTNNKGKRPTAEIILGQGIATPVWSPQIRYSRFGVLLATDFGAAATEYVLTWTQAEFNWLFSNIDASGPQGNDITGIYPNNRSFPKALFVESCFMNANGNAGGTASGSMIVEYTLTGAPGVLFPLLRGNYASIAALSTNEARNVHEEVGPLQIPIQGTTSWINQEQTSGNTFLFDDEAIIDTIVLTISASLSIGLTLAGVNFRMDF